jgi:hypothetical protein
MYVAKDSACESAANAAVREYVGKGLNTAQTRSCKALVCSQRRRAYTVDQSCIELLPDVSVAGGFAEDRALTVSFYAPSILGGAP